MPIFLFKEKVSDVFVRGGGGTPYKTYMGRLRPKRIPFSGFMGYEKVLISLVEVHEKLRKSVISVCSKKAQKG